MKVRYVSLGIGAVALVACASPKPVLYPNAHFQQVGKDAAQQDIEECRDLAESAGAREGTGKAGGAARNTAMGAGVGAASGAVGGAISGSPGLGAAIGAASGATWGLLMSLFGSSGSQPSQAYTSFVDRCLQEKGYEVTGWQ